jgi:cytochrome P450
MIMGVQRSGTTALFETLATAPGLTSYHEAADDAVYFDYYLRPEPKIRALLQAAPGSVLLKPVRESELRSLHSLLDEYAAYDLQIIWLYRDPVNVLYSYERLGWAGPDTFETLSWKWVARNQATMEARPKAQSHLTIVRYEDLLRDPALIHTLAHRFDLKVQSTLETDSNAGRKRMSVEAQKAIDQITATTLLQLDQMRSVRPASDPLSPSEPPIKETKRSATVWRRWLRPFQPQQARLQPAAPPQQAGLSPLVDASSMEPYLNIIEFQRDPYACFRRWRQIGPVHFLPWQDLWLVLNYEDVAAMLRDSARPAGPESVWAGQVPDDAITPGHVCRHQHLNRYLTQKSGQAWIVQCETRVRRLLATYIELAQFDWVEFCRRITPMLFGDLLGVRPEIVDPFFSRMPRSATLEPMHEMLDDTGLLAEMIAGGQWSQQEMLEFILVACGFLHVVSAFLGGMIYPLLQHPQWMSITRDQPEQLPILVPELLRLMPPLLTLNRHTRSDVVISGVAIPAGSLVYLAIGAANRDPDRFEQPDELLLRRSSPAPLTFGIGDAAQAGLGEQAARLMSETLLRVLLTEFPPLRAAQSLTSVEFLYHTISLCGPRKLQVTFADREKGACK